MNPLPETSLPSRGPCGSPAGTDSVGDGQQDATAGAGIGRDVVIDLAKGHQLARVMSIHMDLGGLAPMIAPVFGGAVLSLHETWRTFSWCQRTIRR